MLCKCRRHVCCSAPAAATANNESTAEQAVLLPVFIACNLVATFSTSGTLPTELQARVTASTVRIVDCGVGATDETAHGAPFRHVKMNISTIY
jgi:hypothetical protein